MTLEHWLGIIGGISLFLFGINYLSTGIERMAGSKLKSLLEKLTKTRFLGLLVGLGITAIIQSSNATTVMTVGFVNAGLMSLSGAVGVVMGANIGTTITGQLIAFKIDAVAPIIILIGVVGIMFSKNELRKNTFHIIAGLGLLFLGMTLMKDYMQPLSSEPWFCELVTNLESPILGILVGTIFTLVLQSVSASVGVLQAMAAAGILSLGQAIFVICGQNIGCTIVAVISAIGGNKDAKRTACVHVMFNLIASLLCVLVCQFLPCVEWIESLTPDNVVRQLANANTFLKLGATITMFPFSSLLIKISKIIIPGEDMLPEGGLKHIRKLDFGMTSIAIASVQKEVDRMFALASSNITLTRAALTQKKRGDIEQIRENEKLINELNREITVALVEINSYGLGQRDAKLIDQMHHVIVDFERIGDHADNITDYVVHLREERLSFSEEGFREVMELFDRIIEELPLAFYCMKNTGGVKLSDIEEREQQIDDMVRVLEDNHIRRLDEHQCSADVGLMYLEILTDLERVSDHALNIAQAALK